MYGYFPGNTASDSFFYYMIDLLRLFQTRSFVLSSEHESQNVATIGTLLDQFMLSCKKERLAQFLQCLPRTYLIEIKREA